ILVVLHSRRVAGAKDHHQAKDGQSDGGAEQNQVGPARDGFQRTISPRAAWRAVREAARSRSIFTEVPLRVCPAHAFYPHHTARSPTIPITSAINQKRVTICGSAQPESSKWWWMGLILKIRFP